MIRTSHGWLVVLFAVASFWGCPSSKSNPTKAQKPREPAGVRAAEFERVYRAAKAVEEATSVGVSYPRFQELLQNFATEQGIINDKASSGAERELAGAFAATLAAFKDSATIWRHMIEDSRYSFLDGQISVGVTDKKGKITNAPDLAQIVETYHLQVSTRNRFKTISPSSLQIVWLEASQRLKKAVRGYLGAGPSRQSGLCPGKVIERLRARGLADSAIQEICSE